MRWPMTPWHTGRGLGAPSGLSEQRVSSVVLLSAYPPGASDPNAITRETVAPRTRDDVRGRSRDAARLADDARGGGHRDGSRAEALRPVAAAQFIRHSSAVNQALIGC